MSSLWTRCKLVVDICVEDPEEQDAIDLALTNALWMTKATPPPQRPWAPTVATPGKAFPRKRAVTSNVQTYNIQERKADNICRTDPDSTLTQSSKQSIA